MLIFKYENGQTFTTTLEDLLAMEPRDWVGVACTRLVVTGEDRHADYFSATPLGEDTDITYGGAALENVLRYLGVSPAPESIASLGDKEAAYTWLEEQKEMAYKAAAEAREWVFNVPRPMQETTSSLPSQRELKDLVDYVLMMPVDLRDRMGITVLPAIPTKAVWRLNHQADPSMGWWGVMETRAGLSWGMLHPGRGVTYRDVATWLGMKEELPELPTNGAAGKVLDSMGVEIEVGDTVRVIETIGPNIAGTEHVVKEVQPKLDRSKLEGDWNWVKPKNLLVVRKVGDAVASQQEGGSWPVDGAVEGAANIWADSEGQFKIEALARYLSCMDPTALRMLGLEFKWECKMGEAMLVREETFILRKRAEVRFEWTLWLRRDGFTTAWELNVIPHGDIPPAFDDICRMVGLDFRLDLRSQFTEQPPRAVTLWPHLFKHGVGQPETPGPDPCHDIHGTVIKVGDIVAVEIDNPIYRVGSTLVVSSVLERRGEGRVVNSKGQELPARHVRVVAEKVQPGPEATPDPCTQILCDLQEQLREIMRRVDEAIDARG